MKIRPIIYVTRSEKRIRKIQKWKFTRRAMEEIKAALNAFKDSFSIIYILQYNLNKTFLIATHERSVQKFKESRIIRKSILWIVGPFFSDRVRHSRLSRPSRDPRYFWFVFHEICSRASQKYCTRSFRFFEKFVGVSITQNKCAGSFERSCERN